MNFLKDYNFRVFGLKTIKSEPFINPDGNVIWDGVNVEILLGQFKINESALLFAQNVKNNTSKKSWRIVLKDIVNNIEEEIGYTEKANYGKNKVYQFR